MPTPLILFDDDSPWLSPLNDLRPAFAVRTGAMTTLERWASSASSIGASLACVRACDRLGDLTGEVAGAKVIEVGSIGPGETLFVNSRCVLACEAIATLTADTALVQPGPTPGSPETIVAARLSGAAAREFFASLMLPKHVRASPSADARVLHRPWDVIRHRDTCLDADLRVLAGKIPSVDTGYNPDPKAGHSSDIRINPAPIHIHPTAKVLPGVILDAEGGPIVIDEHAVIRPGTIIVGPAYIGKGSTILERALIKAHTAIGPVCKVTGEIGGTIFQGYANKGHDGHLGDSWVGEWANFGAGTTNSNLLNTYAEVIATALAPGAGRERTGIQYLGCIVGDHAKFAICTRIMTGSVFGTGCMVATTAAPPTCVPAFSWLTDERTQPYRFSKFLDVARTVMGRRKVVPSEAYVKAMAALGGENSTAAKQ